MLVGIEIRFIEFKNNVYVTHNSFIYICGKKFVFLFHPTSDNTK